MKVMALDAEYNQPSRKTIQIGAAIYDAKTGMLVDRFETYVNPKETINPEIVELTGIKDSDVKNAPEIVEAFQLLKAFKESHKVFRNPIVWGSGVRNDSQTLYDEYLSQGYLMDKDTENFMGYRVIDAKSIFQSVQLMRNKEFAGSLDKVCIDILKIGFEGQKHSALADAMNAFRVWHFLCKRFNLD